MSRLLQRPMRELENRKGRAIVADGEDLTARVLSALGPIPRARDDDRSRNPVSIAAQDDICLCICNSQAV